MSIFGKGHYEKIPVLKGEDMPSNIYKVRNVLNKTYFESLFYNVTSELTMMIGEILGVDVATQLKMVDNINVFDMTDDIHNSLETGLYIATQNFSLYIKPGKDMYLIPFNLTNIAMETMQKPEFEAVYYCKFDETPLPVVSMKANAFISADRLISKHFLPKNVYKFPDIVPNFASNYGNLCTSLFKYIVRDAANDDTPDFVHIPKVRVNTWKIPIFTDMHINTVSLIRDLDVQIDFMALPYNKKNKLSKNFESAPVKNTRFKANQEQQGEMQIIEYLPTDGGLDAENRNYIVSSPMGNFIEFREIERMVDNIANYKTAAKIYSHNKRPNRHCRYLVSAVGFFNKPNFKGVEYKAPVQYVRVNKVYDSEGELPMSAGFSDVVLYDGNSIYKPTSISTEGIGPDPEDLTNPMDISIDFEFIQCKVDNNFAPVDTIKIGNKNRTLLGYLVLKAYSGLVGSTLHDGVYDLLGVERDFNHKTTNERYTSYACRTRPHDTFFKVTLRTTKYQNSASGNFTSINRQNIDDEVDNIAARNVWKVLKDNIKDNIVFIDNDEAWRRRILQTTICPDTYNESPIYFAHTINSINKNDIFKKFEKTEGGIEPSFMTSYEKSPDFMWGEYDFYKYRILDKGGYLRPPVQDTVFFIREWWKNTEFFRKKGSNYITGHVNFMTVYLDKYHYDADPRIKNMLGDANVGGVNLKY